ncbi:MAG: ABC transporter substrate-binding protein [Nitrososphaerales archaeon]|nr:ABC transporter substrate-binding protein [Nitrososphaerales archaeon]
MRIKKGVSSVQVGISIVVILLIVGGGAYYFVTLPPNVITTTQTVTSTTARTVTSTSATTATVTVAPTTTTAAAPTLVVQDNSPYSNADPRGTTHIAAAQQNYETLTYLSPNATVLPGLATSWKPIGDGSTWEYTLRQGVTFHDGTTLNATDVVFSILNTVKWNQGDATDVWNIFKSATAVSQYVVDLTFTQPTNGPIITSSAYSAFIFSHNVLKFAGGVNDTKGLAAWFNSYHDDGSGPYVLNSTASSLSGGVWTMNQYKSYWRGWKVGQVTNIIFKLVTNVNTAIQLAKQGQFDVIGVGGQFQFVPQLLAAGLNIVQGPTHGSIWLLFNTQHQYLNNSLVRQALLTAVNYQQIVQQAYYNYGINYNGAINPGLPFYDSTAPGFTVSGNLTAAKALLAQAGYPNGLPNVQWTLTHSTGSPFEATIGALLNTYWQPLGVTVTIQGLSFTNQVIKAGYVNGSTPFSPGPISYASTSKAQDLALLNWNGATSDPYLVPYQLFAIQNSPYQNSIIQNWSYLRNQTFTDLLAKFRQDQIVNPAAAAQDVKTLNQLFFQLAPGWAMFQGQQIWVVSPHWHGVVMNPNYSFDFYFYYDWTYSP